MRRTLACVLAVAALAGLAIPPIAAASARRRDAAGGRTTIDEGADVLDAGIIFGGVDRHLRSQAFRGGRILVWYAGGQLDLANATLDPSGARLRIRTIFGGFNLIVPRTWRVHVRSRGIFGGVGDLTTPEVGPMQPSLAVDILSVFGGVTVRYPREGSGAS